MRYEGMLCSLHSVGGVQGSVKATRFLWAVRFPHGGNESNVNGRRTRFFFFFRGVEYV